MAIAALIEGRMLYPTEETIKMVIKREQPQSNSRTLIKIAPRFHCTGFPLYRYQGSLERLRRI